MSNIARTSQQKVILTLLLAVTALCLVVSCEHSSSETETANLDIDDATTLSVNSADKDVLTANSGHTSDPNKFGVHPSIVSSDVSNISEGTPEAVLSRALNTLYYGNAKDAAIYYQTSMPDFEEQLENTQEAFQKTVRKININEIVYNDDKTAATLKGQISLNGVEQTDYAEFDLEKVNGVWMLLTE